MRHGITTTAIFVPLFLFLPTAKPWSPGLMKRSSALPKLPGTGQLDRGKGAVSWCLPVLKFEILLISCQIASLTDV